jgi:small-conductance mechanosensitive channel
MRRLVTFLAAGLLAAAASLAQEAPPTGGGTLDLIEALEAEVPTAPVKIDGILLFYVRGTRSLPAAERAATIVRRIVDLAADRTVATSSIQLREEPGVTYVAAGERTLVRVFDADSMVERIDRTALATLCSERIRIAVERYRADRSLAHLQRMALRAAAATALFALAVWLVVRTLRWFATSIESRYRERVQRVGIQSFSIFERDRIWMTWRNALLGFRFVAVAALAYAWAQHVLGLFPWTRHVSNEMLGYVLQPLRTFADGFLTALPSLMFLVVLFLVTRAALKLISLFFDAVERGAVKLGDFDAEWAQPTYRVVRIAVVAFVLVVAYPYIPGSGSDAFKGVSLFIGVLFSLGSSSFISNLIAGYAITYRRVFKVGDRVRIGDVLGDVAEMRLQVTHLRSIKNEEITVPNSEILASSVVNYSAYAKKDGLVLHTEVGIGYETPWRQVEAMLLLAAERTPGLLRDKKPFILQKKLGDFCVTYELNVYCDDARKMPVFYTALHRNILDVFNEYGVQIMTPAYEGDPDQPKIVPKAKWYPTPAAPETERSPARAEEDTR